MLSLNSHDTHRYRERPFIVRTGSLQYGLPDEHNKETAKDTGPGILQELFGGIEQQIIQAVDNLLFLLPVFIRVKFFDKEPAGIVIQTRIVLGEVLRAMEKVS